MRIFFTSILLAVTLFSFGQAGPDNCGVATNLPVYYTCINSTFENDQNGTSWDDVNASCTALYGTDYSDVWYTFIGTGEDVEITLSPRPMRQRDAILAIWSDCTFSTELACIQVNQGATGTITLSTTLGTIYYIQIQRRNGGTNGDMDGNICVVDIAPAPSNDNPCSATSLTVNSSCSFTTETTLGSTVSSGIPAPGCGGSTFSDVWFSFTMPASGIVEIQSEEGTLTDGAMALYSGTCTGFTLRACSDDEGLGLMPYLYYNNIALAGQTIWIRYWGYGGAVGTFDLCVTEVQIPGDNPCSATSLPVSSTDCDYSTWSNVGATNTTGVSAPSCADFYIGEDVWYSFTVPATGNVVISTIEGSLTDGALAVYSGTCSGTLTEIGCNEDKNFALLEWMPLLYLEDLTPSETLWIRFWGWGGANGTYGICVIEVPDPSLNQDCESPRQLCDATTVSDNSNGSGSIVDLDSGNQDCLVNGESQSAWYGIQFETGGTFTFTIDPIINESDFDFAVWGPTDTSSCPPPNNPIRCSWALNEGETGLIAGAGDNSEDANGDGFVESITVGDGEIYYLMVDNYSTNYTGFNISFGGTAVISCNILPVTLISFDVQSIGLKNLLQWSTATEINNDYFEVQKSHDGIVFIPFGKIQGAGTSIETLHYSFIDELPFPEITYYRLKQVDYNGHHDFSKIIAIENDAENYFNVFPNPTIDGSINVTFSGYDQPEAIISVYSISGQLMLSDKIENPQEFNQRTIQLPAKGMYTVVVSTGAFFQTQKVVY